MTELQKIDRERQYLATERLKLTHPLRQLFWECTLRCNMSCRHCGSDCRVDLSGTEMPLSDFLPVLDEVAQFCDPRDVLVSTVGGEPLVRPDLLECGRAITERGFRWGLVTNGYLLDAAMLRRLCAAGLKTIAVDVDGVRSDHAWLRNSERSFDRVMEAIAALRECDDLLWDVITCVNGRNIGRMEELKQVLIEAGVKQWRCFTIIPMGRAKEMPELQLSDEQFRDLLNFIVKTRMEGKIDLSYACEGYLGAYEGLVRDYFYTCEAGLTVASIRSDGSISGCLSIRSDYHQGNIYKGDSFRDVWENRFKKYRNRDWMKRGRCEHCEVFKYCQGNGFHLRDENGDVMVCHYNRLKNVKI